MSDYSEEVSAFLNGQKKESARFGMSTAVDVDPDTYAEAMRLSKIQNVPVDTVLANPKEIKKQATLGQIDFDSLVKTSPTTAALLADNTQSKLIHDNIDNMSAIERTLSGVAEAAKYVVSAPGQKNTLAGDVGAGFFDASRGAAGLFQAPIDLVAPVLDPLESVTAIGGNPLRRLSEGFGMIGAGNKAKAAEMSPASGSIVQGGISSGVRSLVGNTLSLPMAVLSPAAALAGMSAQAGGSAYQDAREKGIPVGTAIPFAASQAAIEYATEKIPVSKLVGDLAKNTGFMRMMGGQIVTEAPGEQVATIFQDLNEWAILNPEKPFSEYLKERPSAAAQTLIATAVGVGGNVAVMSSIDSALYGDQKRTQKAQEAEQGAQVLLNIQQLAAADKLLQRDPESFQAFVKQAAQDGPVTHVYIDAQTLMQSGIAEQVAQVSPTVAEQIQVASELGGQIAIPVDEYAAKIAPTDFAQGLIDYIKTDPDGFTRAEAQEYMQSQGEQLRQDVERVLAEKEADTTFQQSRDTVKAQIQQELDALGRFTPQKNEADATLFASYYAVRAAQLGVTPEQFYEQRKVRFAAQSIGGQQFDQGPAQTIDQVRSLWDQSGISHSIIESGDTITVSKIVVPDESRGSGVGTRAMQELVSYADATGKHVLLSPSEDFGGNKKRLTAFYKRFGFVENKGKNRAFSTSESMYRQAQGKVLFQSQEQTDTPEFKRWFGDSKVVDSAGKPLVVYHGTRADFDAFGNEGGRFPTMGRGFYFTSSTSRASVYADGIANAAVNWNPESSFAAPVADGANIVPVYLSIKNPLMVSSSDGFNSPEDAFDAKGGALVKAARDLGHDGIIFRREKGDGYDEVAAVAFKPEQIKSATGNRGTFNPNDPNILNQQARGAFSPESFTITLLKGADLSTALHEGAHFFFENDIALAAELVNTNKALGADTQTEGERQIISDVSILLKWHGIKGTIDEQLATWYGMDFEAKRTAHERTAESFEAYLFEGKAPSIELAPYFQKFRAWLINVYKSLKSFIEKNPEAGKMDDTVRQVFDRMLASSEQIKMAEQSRSMLPLFANPEQAGMTPEEFAAYQKQGMDSTAEAIDHLQARGLRDLAWTRNARGREIKKLQKKASGLRSEVRIEARRDVMAQPVYQAWQFLKAKEDGGKIYLNPTDPNISLEASQKLDELKMTATDGMIPDVVAEQFGFTSGDELIQALTAADDPETAIENLTDQRMMERHGELATPQAIEEAADQAIHNEARARMVATEANALLRAQGDRRVLFDAAREFAAQVVARLKVRDLQPSRYANAAARAGVNAEKASKAGDIATAAAEKRNQLVQTYAAKAANDARDEVERSIKYLRKFDRKGTRENLDTGYLDQIDALLTKFDLSATVSQADRKASLRTWVLSRINAGEMPIIAESLLTPAERSKYLAEVQSRDDKGELVYKDDEEALKLLADAIDNSVKRSHKDMSVEEFRGLVETVKNIEHLARLKNKMLTAREQKNYEQVRDEIAGAIVENAKQKGKNTKTANDWLGRKVEQLKDFGAAHIKVATWARIMDGGKDNGPMWKFLVQPANERATMETTMRAEATAQLDAIMRPLLAKVSILEKAGSGKKFDSLGLSLNWQERFAIALNIGNESNMQRLLGGKGWRFDQVKPVLDTLTAEEWLAVQKIWDHFEQYRPMIAEKEKRVTGKEPEWIAARQIQVQTKDGQSITLRGGYYPVVFDPRTNMKAEADAKSQEGKDMMKAAYSAATTRRGFTKSRVDELHGRPLLLNLQGLYSGVNDVIHDLAWHEWVIDANKLLKSKTIDNAIREHYGPEIKRQFDKWRDDIVMGSRRLDHPIEKGAAFLRQGVSASALTFNLLSAAMQPLGLANSVARVGPKWIGKGVAKYAGAPIETTREVMEKSKWMTNRTRTRFRELNELRNQVQGQTAAKELMGRYGYWLMMRSQMTVDVPTWWGAYERAIAEANDEKTAVQLADQAVKDAQGGGEEVDQSGIERGNAITKLFTAFYGFMGTTLNTAYLAGKTDSNRARATANVLLVLMTPAILGSLLKDALQPGGDDDEELFKKLAAEQISFLLGLVAFGREFSGIAKAAMGEGAPSYSGPAGVRMIPDAGKLIQQSAQGEFDDAFVRSFISVLGDLTGIPAVQINRTMQGVQAVQEGKTDNPVESAAAVGFGFQR